MTSPHITPVNEDNFEKEVLQSDQLFQIQSIPTLVTMKDGQGLLGMIGNHPKSNIEKMVEAALQLAAENNINRVRGPKGPQP